MRYINLGIGSDILLSQHVKKRAIDNLDRLTLIRDLHVAFKISYVYDYITKLCTNQAEIIQNNQNANDYAIGQEEAKHRKYKRPKLGGGQA
jgi:hypothetical protein